MFLSNHFLFPFLVAKAANMKALAVAERKCPELETCMGRACRSRVLIIFSRVGHSLSSRRLPRTTTKFTTRTKSVATLTITSTKFVRTVTKTVTGTPAAFRRRQLFESSEAAADLASRADDRHNCPVCPAGNTILPIGSQVSGASSVVYCCKPHKVITATKVRTTTIGKRVTTTVSVTKTTTITVPKMLTISGQLTLNGQPLAFKDIVITMQDSAVLQRRGLSVLAKTTTTSTGYFNTSVTAPPPNSTLYIADASTPSSPWTSINTTNSTSGTIVVNVPVPPQTTSSKKATTTTLCNCRAPTPWPQQQQVRLLERGTNGPKDDQFESEPDLFVDTAANSRVSNFFQKRTLMAPSDADDTIDLVFGVWASSGGSYTQPTKNNSIVGSKFVMGSSDKNVSLIHFSVFLKSSPTTYQIAIWSHNQTGDEPLTELIRSNNTAVVTGAMYLYTAAATWFNPYFTLRAGTTVSEPHGWCSNARQ